MMQVVESIHPPLQAIKVNIRNSQIRANPSKKIHPDRRLENLVANFPKNLSKNRRSCSKLRGKNGQRYFNSEDRKLVQKIKEVCKTLLDLQLPLDTDYLIIETDGSTTSWGAVLKCRPHKNNPNIQKKFASMHRANIRKKA